MDVGKKVVAKARRRVEISRTEDSWGVGVRISQEKGQRTFRRSPFPTRNWEARRPRVSEKSIRTEGAG